MNAWRLQILWILAKRELRSTIYGTGIYLALLPSLILSSSLLYDVLRGIERHRVLIHSSPISYPLFLASALCAFYLGLAAVTSVAREKETQTLEVLFYGPVDPIAFILSKYLKGMLSTLFILPFLLVFFGIASMILQLGLPANLPGVLLLSLLLSSCLIAFGILTSTLTERVRASILLFLGTVLGLAVLHLTHGILIRMEEAVLAPLLLSLRDTLSVVDAGLRWLSPLQYLSRGLEAVSIGDVRAYLGHLLSSALYSGVALALSILVLRGKGVRKGTGG